MRNSSGRFSRFILTDRRSEKKDSAQTSREPYYNNYGDDFNQFSEPGDPFRNTRMDRMPKEVREGWSRMMRMSRYRVATGTVK